MQNQSIDSVHEVIPTEMNWIARGVSSTHQPTN